MVPTVASRIGERARKRRRSRSCTEYHTRCLSLLGSVYGLPPTSCPPRPQSISPSACAATVTAAVAAKPTIHVSWRTSASVHAKLWTARLHGRPLLFFECSQSSFTIICTNDPGSRTIEFSRVFTAAPGRYTCRHRSDGRGKAQTEYCSLGYVVNRRGHVQDDD